MQRHFCRVGLQDRRLAFHDLSESPERDSFAVRQAAPLPPADDLRLRVHVGEQLRDHAALAHPGLADNGHELHRPPLHRTLVDADQQRFLELAAHERRHVLVEIGPVPHADRLRAPQRQRLLLSLRRDGLERLVLEDVACGAVGLLRDSHAVHGRRTLDPRSSVHDVARDEHVTAFRLRTHRDHGLPRVDAHSYAEVELRVRVVEVGDRVEDAEARAHRAFSVVFVRDGSPERGHHGIADELLDGASIALDHAADASVVRSDARPYVLWILALRRRREPDEIAEQHGHDLSLVLRASGIAAERRATESAEGEVFVIGLAACAASHHVDRV